MPEREQMRSSWNSNAAAWRDAVREHRIESRRLVTDHAILNAVLDLNPDSVLDLGCGEGWLARELAARGVSVTGIDGSEPLIEAARSLGGARYFCVSYEDLGSSAALIGHRFDVIVANFALLDDRVTETLTALRSAVPNPGKMIVQTVHPAFAGGTQPYADGWRIETFDSFSGEWAESMPWYFRTIASWTRAFADAGYTIVSIREPVYADRGTPASIVFICEPAA